MPTHCGDAPICLDSSLVEEAQNDSKRGLHSIREKKRGADESFIKGKKEKVFVHQENDRAALQPERQSRSSGESSLSHSLGKYKTVGRCVH